MAIRVAVDAMGGDHAPSVVVEGAVHALQQSHGELEVLLVGPEALIRENLESLNAGFDSAAFHILDAPDVIGMAEAPAAAVKNKRQSSIHVGLDAHKQGQADAFVSAGNTGAVMAASLFILGRLPNVARPTLLGFIPTTQGNHSVSVDMGSNVDCKPEHLVQFAHMGAVFAEHLLGRANPSVALMNIGEEPGKGNEQIKAAYTLLAAETDLNFKGNIEGRDLLFYAADVIVFDGFVGNIVLKFGESCMTTVLQDLVTEEMERLKFSVEQKELVRTLLGSISKRFNYEEYGGAPLLGVAGNVMIGHGSSSAKAISQLIKTAARIADVDITGYITTALSD
jgi:glycerol-3-phosphate acyltransferase PlsX